MKRQTRPIVYVLHGMKRSGNHALVNWLLPQLQCDFVNNAIALGPILRGGAFPAARPFSAWRKRQGLKPEQEARALLVSLEDHTLQTLPFHPDDLDVRRILIVRKPDQLFSSRIRKASTSDMPAFPRTNDAIMQRAVGIWKQHARCYLGQDLSEYPDRIAISFDTWFTDRKYRSTISSALGVEFDDSGLGRVTDEGGGSSFDGTTFDGRGHLMNVGDRVSQLEPDERSLLDAVLADDEMRALGDQITHIDPFRILQMG